MVNNSDKQVKLIAVFVWIAVFIIISRLFYLQIIKHSYYEAWATNTHEIYKQLFPKRGSIYAQDSRSGYDKEYLVATEKPSYLVYAIPRNISKESVSSTVDILSSILNIDEQRRKELFNNLSKDNDPYEPVGHNISEIEANKIKEAKLVGINLVNRDYRYYPDGSLLGSVLGFVGSDENGKLIGRYGVEGAWNKELGGTDGFLAGKRGAAGTLIELAGKTMQNSEDGADLLLTIDRAIQNAACKALEKGVTDFKAKSGDVVMIDTKTGAIRAMCSYPSFNSNEYYKVNSSGVYNNSNIFVDYEPGSVFKPITMAAGIDGGFVLPDTLFNDPGYRYIDNYYIYNAAKKQYGTVTMTEVLENSINTGVMWVEEKIGGDRFKEYIEKFGYGKKTGIRIDSEIEGDISSLSKTAQVYGANASFGQGFTATPLQLATSYIPLANEGKLLKPYIIEEIRYSNGKVEKTSPIVVDNVISKRTQKLITGMLISVVENGHGYAAQLKDHYVAGKTGTAQIASADGGYGEVNNHTFIGYFPATKPRFVLLVKYEAPQREWAESTAVPTFRQIADFTVKYYGIEGDRN